MLQVTSYTFNPVEENTYILYNEQGQCCIIDPGCYFPEEKERLKSGIETAGLKPILLLNTHCHLDHVFGNKFVHDTWKLDLHLHEKEKPVLDHSPLSGREWGMPFDPYDGDLVYLVEKNIIRIGDEELEILFTPGHSPGSVSFYHKNGGFVIGGDVLFNGSIGRTDLPGANFETLARSIRQQFYTLPDETIVYPGHGPSTTIGVEKATNPFVTG